MLYTCTRVTVGDGGNVRVCMCVWQQLWDDNWLTWSRVLSQSDTFQYTTCEILTYTEWHTHTHTYTHTIAQCHTCALTHTHTHTHTHTTCTHTHHSHTLQSITHVQIVSILFIQGSGLILGTRTHYVHIITHMHAQPGGTRQCNKSSNLQVTRWHGSKPKYVCDSDVHSNNKPTQQRTISGVHNDTFIFTADITHTVQTFG